MAKWDGRRRCSTGDACSIPGPAQGIKDPVLSQLQRRFQLWLRPNPWSRNSMCFGWQKKKKQNTSMEISGYAREEESKGMTHRTRRTHRRKAQRKPARSSVNLEALGHPAAKAQAEAADSAFLVGTPLPPGQIPRVESVGQEGLCWGQGGCPRENPTARGSSQGHCA